MVTNLFVKIAAGLMAALVFLSISGTPTSAAPDDLKIELTVHLEGATRTGQTLMTTDLSDRGLISPTDPYNFNQTYAGVPNAVDWVEVELRNEHDFTVAAEGAAILTSDGSVVTGSGDPFRLEADSSKRYHIIVKHRNHIPEQSPPVKPKNKNKLVFDFSTNTVTPYSNTVTWHVDLNGDGNYGAIPANGAQATTIDLQSINSSDRMVWAADNGRFNGYFDADYNMDGDVNGADRILWTQVKDLIVYVPDP